MSTDSALDESLRAIVRGIVREELAGLAAQPSASDPYLTTADAAALAGVAEGTIRRWVREDRLPGHRAGRVLRVRSSDLHRLLAAGSRAAMPTKDSPPSPEELARRHFALRVV